MAQSVKISATVITYNEEKNIERCLRSLLPVADELLVVDSFSADKTEEIALNMGAKVIKNPFEGHVQQKNFAIDQASYDIILSLDADEALDQKLKDSILSVKENWEYPAYRFNRLTSYCGQWIRHGGWYPDRKIRLWDRRCGRWGGDNPHDKVILKENTRLAYISGDLLHYSFHSIGQHIQVLNSYSEIGAREAFQKGKKSGLFPIVGRSVFRFFRGYFWQAGFRDGYYGFIIAVISAFATFIKYVKLKEIYREAKK